MALFVSETSELPDISSHKGTQVDLKAEISEFFWQKGDIWKLWSFFFEIFQGFIQDSLEIEFAVDGAFKIVR